MTYENFLAWKARKKEKLEKELDERRIESEKKTGKKGGSGVLNGRALFKFDPTLFKDDEGALEKYEQVEEEEEKEEVDVEEEQEAKGSKAKKKEDEVEIDNELFLEEEGELDNVDLNDL